MTITTYRTGLRVIVAVFAVAAAVWLFTIGPLGPWHWHEVARLQVPASSFEHESSTGVTGGPYVASAPFHLSGHDVRLAVVSLTLPSQEKRDPLHATVPFEVSRSLTPRATDDHSAGYLVLQGSAPGTERSRDSVYVLGALLAGQYRLFSRASAAVTLVVRDSRAVKGPALLLLGGLVLCLAIWIALWHFAPRRVLP